MTNLFEFDLYKAKDSRKYAFFYNPDGKVAWAIGLPPPPIPKVGVGRAGPELQADSQEVARQKLIKAIESGNYLNEP
ncbi:MAG: hypothetical protein SWH54_09805 [Thermodesulfobacteriota bacterium]|nr:hypothetical protein [Thermodesulfobacteriota bacterium]